MSNSTDNAENKIITDTPSDNNQGKNKKKKFNKFHNRNKSKNINNNVQGNETAVTAAEKIAEGFRTGKDENAASQESSGASAERRFGRHKNKNKGQNVPKKPEQQKKDGPERGNQPSGVSVKPVKENEDNKRRIELFVDADSIEEQNESKLNEFRNNGLTGENVEIVGVKFKQGGKLYYFSPGSIKFSENDNVIVETVRGLEMGFIAVPNKEIDTGKIVSQLKSVIRRATAVDMDKHYQNKQTEERAKTVFDQKAAERGLEMQLMDVELTFDNSKLIFYFTAEGRVDFRELVKDLAGIFHTRIELRQIGVRDEAKQLGGLGICGQPFCCKRFLSDFAQVSIKMAKDQNLSLASSKISGACGRLMCCLSFEQKVYEMEYATFPRVDSVVMTPAGKGVITESNFLNGKIKVRMDSEGLPVIKTFTVKEVKVIGHIRTNEEVPEEIKKLED